MPTLAKKKLGPSVKGLISASVGERDGLIALEAMLAGNQPWPMTGPSPFKLIGPSGESIPVPQTVLALLHRSAEILVQGDAVCLMPVGSILTTQQAADILNVSRQYLVRLLDGGAIHFTKTGKHRRVRLADLVEYKRARDEKRRGDLQDLTRITQAAGGYPELD